MMHYKSLILNKSMLQDKQEYIIAHYPYGYKGKSEGTLLK